MIWAIVMAALPACAVEDSSNCYWNAEQRGNGIGRSFVAIDLPGLPETVIYLEGEQ